MKKDRHITMANNFLPCYWQLEMNVFENFPFLNLKGKEKENYIKQEYAIFLSSALKPQFIYVILNVKMLPK